jgi:hypothetical protein
MKIWYGYGSEHSMNLVMIGYFKDVEAASKAKDLIAQLTLQVNADADANLIDVGSHPTRFTEGMMNILRETNFFLVTSNELEQFAYDVSLKQEGDKLILTTDESDVSAFLKVFVDRGARVEVFSAHDYPNAPYGRGK